MLLPPNAISNPLLIRFLFDTIASCTEPLLELDGYPEYATGMRDLTKEQQDKVRAVARRIIDSQATGTPTVSFLVRGHADVALREPAATRAEFERNVSQKRADSARNLILGEILHQPGGEQIASRLFFTSKGFGSQFRKVTPTPQHPSLTEAEMRKNRRIEIFTAECPVPPPKPKPTPVPPPPTPVAEKGLNWTIQILSGTAVQFALPEDLAGLQLHLDVEVVDVDRGQKARFGVNTTGSPLPSVQVPGNLSPVQTSMITKGKPADFRTKKGATLANFDGSVHVSQEPGAGVSVFSVGGNFDFSFEQLEAIGIFVSPTVVSVPAGNGAFSLPQAALGLATTGSMGRK